MKRVLLFTLLLLPFIPNAYSQETLVDRLKKHVYPLAADSLMGRKAGSESSQKAADYIITQWQEIGITPWNGVSYHKPFMGNRYSNLIGIIKGNHPVLKDEYIVVGAHYDHLGTKKGKNGETIIYNGADDNASGTATLIEISRILKDIQSTLSRSVILIAFDAEEEGLYGSNDFAHNPPIPIENIKLMFSVDMVGWYQASGYVKYLGSGTIKNGAHYILDDSLIPDGLQVKTQNFEKSILTATDTYGFAQQRIPTLAVTTGLKSPYHKPEDTADLIDYEGMALITEHLANLVQDVSTDINYQSSGRIASKHKPESKFNFGISLQYGSNYHHYTDGALEGKTAGAFSVGLRGKVNMGIFAIRPEVYYDYIQARHPLGKINTQGLTVPLNLMLQTPPSSPAGVALFVGPYYSYRFSGKQAGSALDFDQLFYQNEAGINFGIEVRLSILHIGFAQRQAFTNFTRLPNEDGAHIRNRAMFTTLSFLF